MNEWDADRYMKWGLKLITKFVTNAKLWLMTGTMKCQKNMIWGAKELRRIYIIVLEWVFKL